MQEIVTEIILSDPLFFASAAASIVGLLLWYLYRGFIVNNYTRIKWFRRLFFPHVSVLLRIADRRKENIDLSRLYVETETREDEYAFTLYLDESDDEHDVIESIGGYLIDNKFRPEVLLTSLANHPEGYPEVGNFVLSGPEKSHPSLVGYGVFTEIIRMLLSKWQLHLRIYYDSDKHRLLFYVHREYNAYNPLYAKKHLDGKHVSGKEGVELFKQHSDGIEEFGVELIK